MVRYQEHVAHTEHACEMRCMSFIYILVYCPSGKCPTVDSICGKRDGDGGSETIIKGKYICLGPRMEEYWSLCVILSGLLVVDSVVMGLSEGMKLSECMWYLGEFMDNCLWCMLCVLVVKVEMPPLWCIKMNWGEREE